MAERKEVEVNLHILATPAGCQMRFKASTSGQLRFNGNKVLLWRSVRWVTLAAEGKKQGRWRSMTPTALPAPDIEIG
jgi:hypothetical protein